MHGEYVNSDLVPLKMSAAILVLDQYQEGWPLAQIETGASPAPRSFACQVQFESPFTNVPLVHVGLAGFDIDNRDTARLRVYATDITNEGFAVMVESWMHTRVYRVEVSWMAMGNA